MSRRNTTLAGVAGEHYVMYRLLKLGHLAALTPTGAKGVDILISDAEGGQLAAIQVKTSSDRVTIGWRMDEKHEAMRNPRLFYCFLDPGVGEPTCYIVPSEVVADHVYATHRAWLAGTPKRGNQRKNGPMRKMHLTFRHAPLEAYPDGWMNQYKEAWQLLEQVRP